MRRLIAFPCAGETLAGTVDESDGTTGLLIVSGGNEIRIGAHRGMAELAAALAASGHPVFRFDRRGIGDSTGKNAGFDSSGPDIAAAAQMFRAQMPQLRRIIGFGNCDGATALALFQTAANLDGLILANPWLREDADGLPAPAAIRARYADRLRDPGTWARAVRGRVDLRSVFRGLGKIARARREELNGPLARLSGAIEVARVPMTILLASGDNTALAFADAWQGKRFDRARGRIELRRCDTASHSFARAADKAWLAAQITGLLRD